MRSATFNKKQAVFILAACFFVLLIVELLTFVFFTVFKEKFTFYDIDQFLLTDTVIGPVHRAYQQAYHAQRGWDNDYATPFGERPRSTDYKDPFIATFGDSFYHCDEVANNESWQEYLSAMLQRDVFNFGTGGYGTDQAYLKFREKYPKVRTPVVVIGLTSENINRLVNVYRPFYFPKTGQRLTKPRFELLNGRLTLLQNPITNEEEISKLRDPRFIREIGRHDFWYNRDEYPVLGFPYSKIIFNKRLWREVTAKTDDINPRPWIDLWEDRESRELMFRIIDAFAADVKAAGATPIVMVIPNPREIIWKIEDGRDSHGVVRIREYCRQHGYLYFNPIDGLVRYLRKGRLLPEIFRDHITALGNQIIAHELFNFLKDIDYNK